jgi:hypothetical protein
MRTVRFPIAGLMWAVLVAALGLAALRSSSELWAGATFLATCGILCLAIVGIVCRTDETRAWWLGFALFGWGYLALAFWSPHSLPTTALLHMLEARLGTPKPVGGGLKSVMLAGGFGGPIGGGPDEHFQQIGHCLLALLAALLGGVISSVMFGRRTERDENRVAPPDAPAQARRPWWHWPAAILALSAFVLVVVLGGLRARSSPGFWAGATFFATCGLLGIIVLGAVSAQGKRRQIWLGAALFGIGYMTLAFARSADSNPLLDLPTDPLLASLRRRFPPIVSGYSSSSVGVDAANARILEALEQPVWMHFVDETSLNDVVKFIKSATRGPDGKDIPIYVDPIGLSEADKNMLSTVRGIDLEGVPLKTALEICLERLDLKYEVRDGLLRITSAESEMHDPFYHDSFMIVGHSLLALLAAGLGAIVAPLVPGKRRDV